jgi:hypothetical protein
MTPELFFGVGDKIIYSSWVNTPSLVWSQPCEVTRIVDIRTYDIISQSGITVRMSTSRMKLFTLWNIEKQHTKQIKHQ